MCALILVSGCQDPVKLLLLSVFCAAIFFWLTLGPACPHKDGAQTAKEAPGSEDNMVEPSGCLTLLESYTFHWSRATHSVALLKTQTMWADGRTRANSSPSTWIDGESPGRHTSGLICGMFPRRFNWRGEATLNVGGAVPQTGDPRPNSKVWGGGETEHQHSPCFITRDTKWPDDWHLCHHPEGCTLRHKPK